MPPTVLLGGVTASGKSALALEAARRTGARIVNADSVQLFRDLSVLSARPQAQDLEIAPHQLYGVLEADDRPSVGRYLALARDALAERSEQPAIVVGGGGLYLEALLEGVAPTPPIAPAIREAVRAIGEREGPEAVHALLAREDPAMAAALRPSDPQRCMRALETIRSTGRSLASWRRQARRGALDPAPRGLFYIDPPRDLLRTRIDARLEAMMAAGALEEVALLRTRFGAERSAPIWIAHGARALARHLDGACSLKAALERTMIETRQYAKRQSTWFRNRCAGWTRIENTGDQAPDSVIEAMEAALK